MSRSRSAIAAFVALLLVGGLALGAGVTGVTAQENGTVDEQEQQQEQQASDESEITVQKDVDDDVRVLSTQWEEETDGVGVLEVEVENTGDDEAQIFLIEVMEKDQDDPAAFDDYDVEGGETVTLTLQGVRDHGGDEGVAITTMQAMEQGQSPEWLPVGVDSSPWYEPTWNTVRLAVLCGVLGVVLVGVVLGWDKIASTYDRAKEVDLGA